jgi:hypothetical protein
LFDGSASPTYCLGWLDEVAVYKTALSAAQVLAHYQVGLASVATTRYPAGGLVETNAAGQITLFDADGAAGDVARYAAAPTTRADRGLVRLVRRARGSRGGNDDERDGEDELFL